MKKWLIILLSSTAFYLHARAQSISFSFRNLNINEGLSQNSVVDIAADDLGFLWFATQDGLNRFDGKEFLIIKKNFDDITTTTTSTTGKIAVGPHNDLWLITSGGRLEKMNLYDQVVSHVENLGGVKLPAVSCIYPDFNDNLWIGTETMGLFIYNHSSKKIIQYTSSASSGVRLNSSNIQEIYKDRSGRVWVLTANGINIFNNSITAGKDLPIQAGQGQPKTTSCSSIAEDLKSNLWLGTYGKGLLVKRTGDASFHSFTGFNPLHRLPENLTVFAVMADQLNRIWVGTYGQGLYIINQDDSTITHILTDRKNPFSLGYNDVLSIREDKKGGVWIGTDGGGVSYYDRRLNNFTLYSTSNVPENASVEQIRSIVTDNLGGIWLGTSSNGLTHLNPSKNIFEAIHFSPYKKGISNHERIVSLFKDEEGDIWIGTQGNGLLVIDTKTKKIKRQFHPDAPLNERIPDHTVWCMLPDADGNIWIGTRHAGMSLVNKETGVIKTFSYQSGQSNQIAENNVRKVISINDSILCIGYEKKGIQFLNVNTGVFSSVPALEKIWQTETIVKAIYFKYPTVWIGTLGKGIIAYNIATKQVDQITEDHGLPNHTVYGIVPDKSNALWLSSNKGISRFIPSGNLKAINRSNFTVFSVEDGLQSNEFNTGAYHQSEDGMIFFGGITGLNIFNPEKMIVTNQPISAVIIQTTINNQPWAGDTTITFKKSLHLNHRSNSLAFNFAALDFVSADKLSYYYQLDDYDKNWISAGNRNYASYTNLPPGRYVFKVKASVNSSTDTDPVTTLSIIIDPPFWRTWWFIGLSLLAVTAILYGLYRYRINQLIQLQKVRNRIATDLHDDIGSTLTNISILSELSRKNVQDHDQTKNFLNRISEEVYFSSQALDDIVWSINTSNDNLEQTVARMRRYAAEVFDGANITYTLQLDEQFEHYKLSMELRRDCFLLFKEAINNIYKHAQASNVSIKVWIDRNQFNMEIKDDGKGFDTTSATTRNGLKNMHSRAGKWKGEIKIRSAAGKGTSTQVRFPL